MTTCAAAVTPSPKAHAYTALFFSEEDAAKYVGKCCNLQGEEKGVGLLGSEGEGVYSIGDMYSISCMGVVV